jgi:hypothetical protein
MNLAPIIPLRCKDLPPEKDGWAAKLKLDGFRGLADTINRRMLSKNVKNERVFEKLGFEQIRQWRFWIQFDCFVQVIYCGLEDTGNRYFGKRRVSMKNNELVVSLVFGAIATFVVVLVWGRRLVDLLPIWAFGG